MEIIDKIINPISMWEIVVFIVVVFVIRHPDLLKRITKLKIGDFEMELSKLKKDFEMSQEKITELEEDLGDSNRQFQELLIEFNADAPLSQLSVVKQRLKSQSRNISDMEVFSRLLTMDSSPEELYAAAVSIREKRPVNLLPKIISFLDYLAQDDDLGGYRLNTIWTLTSAIHKILISCVRDGIEPFPKAELLDKAEIALRKLETHPKVVADRPDNPMKGIRGPIKHSLQWIQKAREKQTNPT
jgi:hypothetical protein